MLYNPILYSDDFFSPYVSIQTDPYSIIIIIVIQVICGVVETCFTEVKATDKLWPSLSLFITKLASQVTAW